MTAALATALEILEAGCRPTRLRKGHFAYRSLSAVRFNKSRHAARHAMLY